jgi:hypothetical protein
MMTLSLAAMWVSLCAIVTAYGLYLIDRGGQQ